MQRLRGVALFAGLIALSLLVYGSHTFDPPLSDDFASLRSAPQGSVALVRGATVDSYPRTLRPLPALLWRLQVPPADLSLIHVTGFVVHGMNGALVGLLALLLGASQGAAAFAAVAFVTFPLFAEPVIWASCGPDRLATLAGLITLCVFIGGANGGRRVITMSIFISAALLSKESTLTLPFICLALCRTAERRALLGVLVPLALYMAARLLMFGGIGGYHAAEALTTWQPAGERLWRTLFVYLPYLTVVPVTATGWQRWFLGTLSSSMLGVLLWRIRISVWRRLVPAVALALLPALPVLGLDADRLGSRFLYWPMAVVFPLIACALPPATALRRAAWAGLSLLWTAAAVANGQPWSRAGEEVSKTIAAMRRAQGTMEAGTVVMVDAKDSVGAYVFRNGLSEAALVLGLRSDLQWRRGTAANLSQGEIQGLGRQVRVLGIDPAGFPRELTDCERSVHEAPELLRTIWRAGASGSASASRRAAPRSITFRTGPTPHAMPLFMALRIEGAHPLGPGLVQWRTATTPFSMSRSRTFWPDEKAVTYVRVDPDTAQQAELRVIFPALASISELGLVEAGPRCIRATDAPLRRARQGVPRRGDVWRREP